MQNLTYDELMDVTGGFNWENFTYGVAAVGAVAVVAGCPPLALVCGVYEASYWITRAVVE